MNPYDSYPPHGQYPGPDFPRDWYRQMGRPVPRGQSRITRNIILVLLLILVSNVLTHGILNYDSLFLSPEATVDHRFVEESQLYLLDEAGRYIRDTHAFETKVREVANLLRIPPEWLMAVIYSESRFNPGVKNHQGSGAVGLIQFMPTTASDMNVSMERLRTMGPVAQLEYVYLYLENVRKRNGEFSSLTDLYLAILYPRARKQDPCYSLYTKPGKRYTQNSGLDENRDGSVTISDIDMRLRRLYPQAYIAQL